MPIDCLLLRTQISLEQNSLLCDAFCTGMHVPVDKAVLFLRRTSAQARTDKVPELICETRTKNKMKINVKGLFAFTYLLVICKMSSKDNGKKLFHQLLTYHQ